MEVQKCVWSGILHKTCRGGGGFMNPDRLFTHLASWWLIGWPISGHLWPGGSVPYYALWARARAQARAQALAQKVSTGLTRLYRGFYLAVLDFCKLYHLFWNFCGSAIDYTGLVLLEGLLQTERTDCKCGFMCTVKTCFSPLQLEIFLVHL